VACPGTVKAEIVGIDDNAAAATVRFLQSRGTEEKFSLLWGRQQATYFVTAKVHFTRMIIVSKGSDYSGRGTSFCRIVAGALPSGV